MGIHRRLLPLIRHFVLSVLNFLLFCGINKGKSLCYEICCHFRRRTPRPWTRSAECWKLDRGFQPMSTKHWAKRANRTPHREATKILFCLTEGRESFSEGAAIMWVHTVSIYEAPSSAVMASGFRGVLDRIILQSKCLHPSSPALIALICGGCIISEELVYRQRKLFACLSWWTILTRYEMTVYFLLVKYALAHQILSSKDENNLKEKWYLCFFWQKEEANFDGIVAGGETRRDRHA